MARPKPDVELVQVLLRLTPDLISEIDKRRGDLSRPKWVRLLLVAWAGNQLSLMSDAEMGQFMRSTQAPEKVKPEVGSWINGKWTVSAAVAEAPPPKPSTPDDGHPTATGIYVRANAALPFGPQKRKPGDRLKKR